MAQDDWFLPAIMAEGGVGPCLDFVLRQEESRLFFIKSLKSALWTERGDSSDAVHHLRKKIEIIDNTCQLRLGVLTRARPKAWFRKSPTTELGPFPGEIIKEAVLVEFAPELARKLRNELVRAWDQRSIEVPSLPPGECLWRTLLELNRNWLNLCKFSEPFQDLRLDELPEGLPDDLSCRSLIAFLKEVRAAIDVARAELDNCFQKLFQGTETFLGDYYQKPKFNKQRRQGGLKTPKRGSLGESLAFMDFQETPSSKELKRRYLELARTCHPDVTGGGDAAFKSLTHHYHQILKCIPKT